MLVHTRDTLSYACMLVGQFFHAVPQMLSPTNPCLLSALQFPLLSPLLHLLHDRSSFSSSTCRLFFYSGGERANKQNRTKLDSLCMDVSIAILQYVSLQSSCTRPSFLSEQHWQKLALEIIPTDACQTKKTDNDHQVLGSSVVQPFPCNISFQLYSVILRVDFS